MNDPCASDNVPEYTVTEISAAVKRTLETAFGRVRVRGEITELKRYPSGHMYLSLKDETGKLSGVVWKTAIAKLGLLPENGVEVIAQGRISSYSERSSYQLIIERMDYAGAGALLARIEKLRQRLAAEGLFDSTRKRPLPLLPQVIGVITSESGAVIQDIRTTISRRFPRRIILWPVAVQGADAAEQIARAIAGFDAILPGGPIPRPDILIIARGGGGLEDLMAFNDKVVLRAAAACSIPMISAVGHETDTTLIDLVSDRRAPTPTAAAEFAVPQSTELSADLRQKSARIGGALNRIRQERHSCLQRASHGLPDLSNIVGMAQQKLDDRSLRHELALRNLRQSKSSRIEALRQAFPQPASLLASAQNTVSDRHRRLALSLPNLLLARRSHLLRSTATLPDLTRTTSSVGAALGMMSQTLVGAFRSAVGRSVTAGARILPRLHELLILRRLSDSLLSTQLWASRLEGASYQRILDRGFVLITTPHGKAIKKAANVRSGAELTLHFRDGTIAAKVVRKAGRDQLPLL